MPDYTPDLWNLARLAEVQPEFCAYLMRAYLDANRAYTEDDLARQLRCSRDRLVLLWLSLRPGSDWDQDVAAIARKVVCDRDVLDCLLRAALMAS